MYEITLVFMTQFDLKSNVYLRCLYKKERDFIYGIHSVEMWNTTKKI